MTASAAAGATFVAALALVIAMVATALDRKGVAVFFAACALFLLTLSLVHLMPAAAKETDQP